MVLGVILTIFIMLIIILFSLFVLMPFIMSLMINRFKLLKKYNTNYMSTDKEVWYDFKKYLLSSFKAPIIGFFIMCLLVSIIINSIQLGYEKVKNFFIADRHIINEKEPNKVSKYNEKVINKSNNKSKRELSQNTFDNKTPNMQEKNILELFEGIYNSVKEGYENVENDMINNINSPEEIQEYLNSIREEIEQENRIVMQFVNYISENYNFNDEEDIYNIIVNGQELGDEYLYVWYGKEILEENIVPFLMEEVWKAELNNFIEYDFSPYDIAYVVKLEDEYHIITYRLIEENENIEIYDEIINKKDYRKLCTVRINQVEHLRNKPYRTQY